MGHRHKDSRAKWTTTDAEPPQFTAAEVTALKLLIAAGGSGGGTTPVPTPPPLPTPGPVISNLVIEPPTTTGATITWTTDVATTGVVVYGTGTGYGSTTAATASGTSHSRTLSGLTPGTTYHLQVRATASGQTTASSDRTFTTQQVPAPPPGTSITVASISALKAALDNNSISEIIVANGTYQCSSATLAAADALNIGASYGQPARAVSSRTNPVTVRAETTGGVTFNNGGGRTILWFTAGVHDQTWIGFKFANCRPTQSGVVFIGSVNANQMQPAAHHITLQDCEWLASCVSGDPNEGDHALYITKAIGGVHHITVDGADVDGSGGLNTFVHIYDDGASNGAHDVAVTNFTVTGTHKAIMVWWASAYNLLFQNGTITGATKYAISPYRVGANVVFDNVDSTGSGSGGNEGTVQGSPTINPNCSLA